MSFSAGVKEELSKLNNLANKDCVKLEFIGYLLTINTTIVNDKLRFSTENEYNINRFSKLLNNLYMTKYDIEIQGKNYIITSHIEKIDELMQNVEKQMSELEEKAIVRGVFLGSGSINEPKNKYHMEIILKEEKTANYILKILEKYNIKFKILNKKKGYSIYSKDGEEISKTLAFMGANSSVLKFEDIRVYRDMRNNINRLVNCETANLTKTISASVKQIEAINLLKEIGKFSDLSDSLKEIAELRIKNPESSLVELGNMLKEPIGKSGVNHRLKAIVQLAEEFAKDVKCD